MAKRVSFALHFDLRDFRSALGRGCGVKYCQPLSVIHRLRA